jgi:UDP-glucose-4-epimerase GalE
MNVLVTGGAGYIGSHTAKALAQAGHHPVVYDNLSKGHRWAVRWGPLVEGDLRDPGKLTATLREHRIEAVIHFAAFIAVGESVREPVSYLANNVAGTLALLESMRAAGVGRLIFSSTAAVYGDPVRVPLDELHPLAPINPYGDSKLMAERAFQWAAAAGQLNYVALRYFNACGGDREGEIGELHDPETHLIPLVLESILDPQRSLKVFGTDFPTPDGTAVRDYIHVEDLAAAHLQALAYLADGGPSEAMNLGTGQGYSVRQILDAAARLLGPPAYQYAPRREGDPPELVADSSKARRILGWQPTHSSLEEILESAWRWRTVTGRAHFPA